MKKVLLGLLFVLSMTLYGQQAEEWIQKLEHPTLTNRQLCSENRKVEFFQYDFSSLMLPKHQFLGYIGNYFRIGMKFTSVAKNKDTLGLYNIQGVSHFGKGEYSFDGVIRMDQVREFKSMHFGADSMYKDKGMRCQGAMVGSFEFRENPKIRYSGFFKGVMTVFWYLDKNGKLCYDDVELFSSDSYHNNQYVGAWSPYGSAHTYICNWGEFRIPFSGDLDMGAAEFSPNPRYSDKGWGNLDSDLPVIRGDVIK